ncbi:hypothetical protein BN1049_01633 [Pseudomonas saudimassiliensis]|uniref:DUF2071 domain-containing protein n=1 Tax=Pseudomonas saudimassiliensis TaxID=1461581 RepID=A0A078MEB5_9PSED|nr:DUF2071 domain-containing protein [Pseudomonas saudimassiliensis]CEA04589.1 hypothetical protein BN1049_01633 [Pseudomonas saudimassiliensis]CEF26700.1 hypothetical protein BN1049_01633 [Pseudomonas saudimassiliensis]
MQHVTRGPEPAEQNALPVTDRPWQRLRFADHLVPRPPVSGINVRCRLEHFAIVSYAVDPAQLRRLIPPRFMLDTLMIDGRERGLVSAVPFRNVDFTLAAYPCPYLRMGQTDYRAYIIDRLTGERAVWFFGTTLDSWALPIPRHVWQQPWHRGRLRFDCALDPSASRYEHYRLHTAAPEASVELSLTQRDVPPPTYPGFPDEETALVYLTHPLVGFFHRRRDGHLGAYRVWHDQLKVTPGRLLNARFDFFARLGLVSLAEQQHPHSVLMQPINDFTVFLPPTRLEPE